ncbi:Asparagine--tRNA ligase mitochondrial [Spathaspora sp. JA1]|nr:Asparagine--tRNA ligase mitochondrial [Spathaspora sp. JA1]
MLRVLRRFHSLSPTIKDIHVNPPSPDSIIEVKGYIKNIRQYRKVGFIDINDGSIFQNLNITLKNPKDMPGLKIGQSLSVKGDWKVSPGKQPFEVVYDRDNVLHSMNVIGDIAEDYPLHKEISLSNLRQFPSLRHRTSKLSSILRLRSFVETKFMEFFNKNGFVKVTPPIITSSDCEGAGEVFKVEPLTSTDQKFFGKDSYLTVSTQLHLEALALAVNRAWTLSPCFRAENSNTSRHLCEFWMLEAELCYIDRIDQLTGFTEDMVRYIVRELVKEGAASAASSTDSTTSVLESGDGADLLGASPSNKELLVKRWSLLLTPDKWPSMTYTEAITHLNKQLPQHEQLKWGDSLQLKHEKQLASTSPIFITDYPASQKPFYMLRSGNASQPTVACFDLLIPEFGELAGGSLREHNYDVLVEDMKLHGMNLDDMDWYLTLRRHGTIPHGGFGLGFERLITYLSGRDSLRDVAAFPRAPSSNRMDQLNVKEQQEFQQIVEQKQMKDFMNLYSNLVGRCFEDCVNDFTSASLTTKESSCIAKCSEKFLKHSERVGQRFQEQKYVPNTLVF